MYWMVVVQVGVLYKMVSWSLHELLMCLAVGASHAAASPTPSLINLITLRHASSSWW